MRDIDKDLPYHERRALYDDGSRGYPDQPERREPKEQEEEPKMLSPEEIQFELSQCYGSEHRYRISIIPGAPVATDGVYLMANLCRAFWLLTAIASHQTRAQRVMGVDNGIKNPQFWTLRVTDGIGNLFLSDGNEKHYGMQKFTGTDFPLPEISVWIEFDEKGQGVMLLPSEH